MQVGRATDALERVETVQAAGDNEHVNVAALREEVQNGLVDQLVRGEVEVVRAQALRHVQDDVRVEQHRADNGALGELVVRRSAVLLQLVAAAVEVGVLVPAPAAATGLPARGAAAVAPERFKVGITEIPVVRGRLRRRHVIRETVVCAHVLPFRCVYDTTPRCKPLTELSTGGVDNIRMCGRVVHKPAPWGVEFVWNQRSHHRRVIPNAQLNAYIFLLSSSVGTGG